MRVYTAALSNASFGCSGSHVGNDTLAGVVGGKLDHDGRERLLVVGGGDAEVEVLQRPAGQNVEALVVGSPTID